MSLKIDSGRQEKEKVPFLGSGMEWVVLSISLLVAAVVWLVYNLSQPYSAFLDFPVNITSDVPGYESRTETDQRLILRGKAAGFFIIYRKVTVGRDPIEIKVDGKYLIPVEDRKNTFAVATSNLRKELSAYLGDYVDLEYVVTDSLTFTMVPTEKKKVPVRADASLSCASQYAFFSELTLDPDSVYISGKSSMVSSIDAVWTEKIYRTGIDGNIQGMVDILKVNGLDISTSSVMYDVEVKRYVEETITVPVYVKNLPPDRKAVLLPDQVELSFRRWYPLSGRLEPEDFTVMVDYDIFVHANGAVTVPEVVNAPDETFGYSLNPQIVECLLLKK